MVESERVDGGRSLRAGRIILAAAAAAVLLKVFLFDFTLTEGESMEPAIRNGKLLLVLKTAFGFRPPGARSYVLRWARPRKGDVVVFYTPKGDIAVKRCGEVFETTFFALGDNAASSYDSRYYGPVPLDNIIGKAVSP
jgi:signal peptidase I